MTHSTERPAPVPSRGTPGRVGPIVVANRLPVARVRTADGARWERSPGGLVSALAPLLEGSGGAWVGWAGAAGDAPEPFRDGGIDLVPVALSRAEVNLFYAGFSNGVIWPLYHDAVRWPEFERSWWQPYVDVNRRFARAAAERVRPGGTVWVHDYQLQRVPAELREIAPAARIGFFLHIPFPPVELFGQLPWRREVLEGLLGADLVGFQTELGAKNFALAATRYTDAVQGEGYLSYRGRKVHYGAHPISIDTARYAEIAARPSVRARAEEIRHTIGDGRRILLGVDRLDYTKGIDRRLSAFAELLDRYDHALDAVVLVQVAVPSREAMPDYAQMRGRVEQQVGHINGMCGDGGRVPVHYLYRNLPQEELVAWYSAADVMLVTPLRDGMNLVAKEFVACRPDGDGVLVLSEFAGAAKELDQALLVNPHDVDGMATAFEQALEMPLAEQRRRMASLRRVIDRRDVHTWAAEFLDALET